MIDKKKASFDCVIVGGGASGLMLAVSLAKQSKSLRIAVLEALDRVGKKLSLTGNGQCNISNTQLSFDHFHSNNEGFFKTAINKYGYLYTKSFFEKIGINIFFKPDGRAYPRSLQASSVVDALRFEAENLGVALICGTKVTDFSKKAEMFEVTTNSGSFTSKYLVMACGLLSGGEKVGAFNNGIKMLEKAGFKTVKLTPSIAQIKAENGVLRSLKGIKTDSLATLKIGDNAVDSQKGEILFTDYGLSGPAILRLSRECSRVSAKCEIVIDLFEEYTEKDLLSMLFERRKNLSERNKETLLCGLLQNRLAKTMLVYSGLNLDGFIGEFSDKELEKLAISLKNFSFSVVSTTGFIHSQATAGGIDTSEVFADTMQSKKIKGLYITGELLDVDGDCGGYNLQWAWSSAFCAAESIAGENK